MEKLGREDISTQQMGMKMYNRPVIIEVLQ
jgi:hypothetical protein